MRPRSVGVPMPNSTADREPAGLLCPDCRRRIEPQAPPAGSSCGACGWRGQEADGIAILLRDPELSVHDELDHEQGGGHKAAQSAALRPAGGGGRSKLTGPRNAATLQVPPRREVPSCGWPHSPIHGRQPRPWSSVVGRGWTLNIWRASVPTSRRQISHWGQRSERGSERSGTACALPPLLRTWSACRYEDESFDTVAVHDGLHHLADPFAGLSEMARIARRLGPGLGTCTSIGHTFRRSVRSRAGNGGPGNRVARLEVRDVSAFLSARGFVVLRAERYAMYYPHHPGATFRLLSRPGIFPIVRVCWRIANKLVGRFGNKMVVVAERERK